jgi:hypothetical protein
MKGDVADVAAELNVWGDSEPGLDAESVTGLAAFMLANVAAGRALGDHDLLRQVVVGIPASTARDYRRLYGEAALSEYLRRIQYKQDLVALMRAGRKLPAARRYLELHPRTPSMTVYPAPPARRRRSDPPMMTAMRSGSKAARPRAAEQTVMDQTANTPIATATSGHVRSVSPSSRRR